MDLCAVSADAPEEDFHQELFESKWEYESHEEDWPEEEEE